MACIGNMPSFKYVTVESLVITYNGTPHPIKAFATNKKYIVWNIDRPYQLEDTNVRPDSSLLEYLIVINDNGKPTIVEHDELLYSFNQTTNGSNLISSSEYNSFKSEVGATIKKFNLMSNTVDDMSQTIGVIEELEDGSIVYNLNKIKSDSKHYESVLSEIQTKVNDAYEEIKPIVLNALVEYLRSVSEYKLSFTNILEDTLITIEELTLINTSKTNIISKFNELQTTLSDLKAIVDSVEDIGRSQLIVNAKIKLTTLHDNLVSMGDSYLLNNKISGEEKTNIIQKAYELATYIGTVQNTCINIMVNGGTGIVNLISNSNPNDMDGWRGINAVIKLSEDLNTNIKNPVKVHFIWLPKEGDCILIQCDNGKNVLIDGGEEITADSTVSYLYAIGIKQIDLIIATHSHSDHIGATPKIIDNFGCKELLIREPDWSEMPEYEIGWETKEYHEKLIAKANEVGAIIRKPYEGEVINISDEISLKIFNTLTDNYTAYNNLSFSILMTHFNNKYFFGGDMCIASENAVLGKLRKVDVLCVGHSGYDDTTSSTLLSEIRPNYSIILNPAVSSYSEQFGKIRTEETRHRLQYAESIIYATEQNGTIVLNSNNEGYSVNGNNLLLYTNKWWLNNSNWYWFKTDGKIAKNENIWIFDNTLQKWKLFNFNEYGICTNPYS